ncbi:amidohydrolase [Paraflavitalea sp. CAU 1676]|uniref:amidohydrolase n=1 Tax=Paraflavitalea sp. CAU 1676 TaxID=3032598 RepID=UPI0023DA7320|nr:amidohydrolase [Paraflavitalea sp. CAU 1676]MDF2191040.1 amidohydrolase [Paraflavitalea sp. CAU 1676]
MSTITITTIQTVLHWENKAANLQMLEEKINQIGQKTEIVVLPEMFSTGFSMKPEILAETMEGDTIAWMKKIAQQKRIVLTGSLIIEDEGHYYNRLVWMLPNGQLGYYDKRHLFAYAGEHEHFAPGHKRLIASVKGWKINLLICYDLRFPVWARQATPLTEEDAAKNEPEYDLMIYVANWPERRNHAWKTLLQARAIENQSFVVGVNRVGKDGNEINHSGDSMVVDPLGEVLYTKANEEDIHTITLHKEKLEEVRHKLPFLEDADNFIIQS